MQALVVVPPDPFERGEFDCFDAVPGLATMDQFGFVEVVDCLSEGIVVGVAAAAD